MRLFGKLFSKKFFKNDIAVAMVCAIIFTAAFSLAGFETNCEKLRQNILRLHILANSDSNYDQTIKLKVRDCILETSENLFENLSSKEEALSLAKENIPLFKKAAQNKLKELGYNKKVEISVGKAYFNTREYENFTLPAGEYDAVRVLIGEAEGKNWWCVMFPSMCIPAASQSHSLDEAVEKEPAEIAQNAPKYKMEFKIVEWFEKIKNFFA